MSKSVILNLGSGDLYQGFPRVTVQLWTTGNPLPEQFVGTLPAAPDLVELYRNWQLVYQGLCDRLSVRQSDPVPSPAVANFGQLEISETGITHVSQVDFDELCQQLQVNINAWLRSEGFLAIEYQLRSRLNASDLIRVIVETEDWWLRHLPWHRWHFFQDYPKAEMALSQPEYQRRTTSRESAQTVRILAVFGNSDGIDLAAEARLLEQLQNAQVKFLVNPSRQAFTAQLWQPEGWDILFFAGHSQAQGQTGRIYINENPTHNSLTIPQLEEALKAAIERGLQLAIFNSCDGLGLAQALEQLYIPTVIVMREPVPNCVAQAFFAQFLLAFARDRLPLYLAVQQARRQLQGLEDDFPAASWLPVICQNLAVAPPTWLQLGGIAPCPYRGLFAFQEEDASLFFGREKFAEDLLVAVNRMPLVAVVGPSGSGKSSVVFAGLVPLLRQDRQCQIVSVRPGSHPIAAIAEAFSSLKRRATQAFHAIHPHAAQEQNYHQRTADLAIALRCNQEALSETIKDLVQAPTRLLLIVDQFEELYTLSPEAERQPFLDGLLSAVTVPGFTLVITLRADFYGQALSYRPFSDALQRAVHNLGPMNRSELRAAIEAPAANSGVRLEAGLSNRLIDDVWKPGSLPLLEFALTQLWSKQNNELMTHQAYAEIGGVDVALANHAESVYAQLSEADRQRSQQVFMQLVHLEAEREPTRRLATRDEVKEENWDLIAHLASSRLVVTNYNASIAKETVEIVHETLIKSWERLEQWIRIDGDFRRWQQQLRLAERQWENADDERLLLRWKPLADAEYWYHQRRKDLSSGDSRFIEQSLALREREARKQKRTRQLTLSGLTGGLVFALMLAGTAFYQWRQAHIREIEATSQFSEALFATNYKLEALVEAIRAKRNLQMPIWADRSTQKMVNLALRQAAYGLVEYNRLSARVDGVTSVAFSPDGKTIAAIPENGVIQLWNADGTLRATLTGHDAGVNSVAFSPDGKTIASAANDETIRLWNADGSLRATLTGHDAEVTAVAFSPDGKTIASAANDDIRLWNADGTLRRTFGGHDAGVTAVAFSPDGKTIASASSDATIKLWTTYGDLKATLAGHSAEVTGISFSPTGDAIASASKDETAKLWTIDGELRHTLLAHQAEVTDISFSPDGKTIASASADKTIKLWRDNGTLVTTLEGHRDIVWGIDFSPDGKTIASASWDDTVRLWRYENPLLTVLSGHSAGVTGVSFSPDGQQVVSASDDKTVKLWDASGTLLKTIAGHRGRVYDAVFSPDGQTIASASDDTTVKLWDRQGTLLKTLEGHSAAVWGVSFSPDGRTIATTSDDKTVKLWSREGTLLRTLEGHQSTVFKAVFSPDGQTLFSVSGDTTVKRWQLDGTLLKTYAGHIKSLPGGDISPNGQMIASASNDKAIKLWQLNGSLQRTIEDDDRVQDVAFSPNGQMIASASMDRTAKLWRVDGTLLKTFKRHGAEVWGIDYSPNGQQVVSSSANGSIILWNLQPLLELDELSYACNQVKDYLKNGAGVQARDRTLCDP